MGPSSTPCKSISAAHSIPRHSRDCRLYRVRHRRRQQRQRHQIRIKRVYKPPDDEDGVRVLVDRLWPRGLSREKARIDLWLKEIAPSNTLRRRFHGNPAGWENFKTAYYAELGE